MKNFFKSKRNVGLLGLGLAVLLAIGATFAWFSSSATVSNGSVQFGELGISGSYELDPEDVLYEPGTTAKRDGVVTNTGTLPFWAKLELNATTTLAPDANGNQMVISGDSNVGVEIDENALGYKDLYDDQGEYIGYYAWFVDTNTGEYYLFMDEGMEAEVTVNAVFDGKKMGNEYQGATISLDSTWNATQALDGAFEDTFGISPDGLEMVMKEVGASTRAGASTRGLEIYNEIMALMSR